jgi:SAM-dependent methyltransferase
MARSVNETDIIAKAEAFGQWYHKIELVPGYVTRGFDWDEMWNHNRKVRNHINYNGRSVLDLGTMDGLWAFEAERLRASTVWATDCYPNARLAFAKEALGSSIILAPSIQAEELAKHFSDRRFDIIQNLGLLYHLQNPLLFLGQVRALMADGGVMFLETGCWTGCPDEPVLRYNNGDEIYNDASTYWLPNLRCLLNLLELTGFKTDKTTISRLPQTGIVERVALIAHV